MYGSIQIIYDGIKINKLHFPEYKTKRIFTLKLCKGAFTW